MIVDVHTHLPTHTDRVPRDEERVDTVMRPDRPVRLTNSVDDYLDAMGHVDRAILFGIALRRHEEGLLADIQPPGNVNDLAAAVASRMPAKIVGFMSVHPDAPNALDELERCVHDLGLRGIKLGANYQDFDPVGKGARRLYEYAQRNSLPIVFHQGTSPVASAPLRYSHPLAMDDVAMEFSDLKIVMAHLGHPWHVDCFSVVRKHPNVYADVSAQFYRPWSMYNGLSLAYEWGITDKILFASDWPVTTPDENIAALGRFNAFAAEHHLPEVPQDVFEGIIHRDALGLLGLE